jgi:hypothetical protein
MKYQETRVILLHRMIQQLHKELYNALSIELSEFIAETKLAWSPSSSCATGEHVADRLVTLSYLS